MCLFTNDFTPKTSDKPIRCIKVTRKCKASNGDIVNCSIFNPMRKSIYIVGKCTNMNKNGRGMKSITSSASSLFNKKYVVFGGLHSFNIDDPDKAWNKVIAWGLEKYKHVKDFDVPISLLECEIPAGTLYYEGVHNCTMSYGKGEPGYVSTSLKVIREIPINVENFKDCFK